jgi:adenine-specific DNA-methyltransferase
MANLFATVQQSWLFPGTAASPVREGYNPEELKAPMTAPAPDRDPQSLATTLAGSLCFQLRQAAAHLGLRLSPGRTGELSWRMLGLSGEPNVGSEPVGSGAAPLPATEDGFELHDYLHLVPEEMRRALGQVMTPQPIARYILRAARYRPDEEILERTLCDPACGSGVFLVEACRLYLGALRRSGVPPAEWYPRAVSHHTGIDVDPLACLYARFNLSLLLAPALISWIRAHPRRVPEALPVHQLDTLETLAGEMSGDRTALPLLGSFDFVVGNPPYRKVSPLSPVLREVFADSLYGHPNAYGMFLHAGVEMLRPGGRLGFIVPRSMLSGLYFQNLRRFLEQRTCLEELAVLAERKNVFPQVLQGTMIVVCRRRADDEPPVANRTLRTTVIRSTAEFGNGGPPYVTARTDQVTRRMNGTTIWFVSDRERTYALLDKIIGRHPLLGGPDVACPARTGPIVWNRVKPHLRPWGGDGTLPLVWATDVGRFHFALATAGKNRPAYLEEAPQVRDLAMMGASLLVQRVTADEQAHRIVAGRAALPVRQRYFVENHLNVLQPKPGARVDLHFLLGILSSNVVEFLFRSMNGNTQVSASELNLLPIPRGGFESEIAEIAAALERTEPRPKKTDLEAEMNERIARAYGLTGRDLGFLQGILRENPALQEIRRDD